MIFPPGIIPAQLPEIELEDELEEDSPNTKPGSIMIKNKPKINFFHIICSVLRQF